MDQKRTFCGLIIKYNFIARQNHDAWPARYEHFSAAFDETDRILTDLMDNFQIQNAIDALRRLNLLLNDVQEAVCHNLSSKIISVKILN